MLRVSHNLNPSHQEILLALVPALMNAGHYKEAEKTTGLWLRIAPWNENAKMLLQQIKQRNRQH